MKKILMCLFLASSIFLNGCFSYVDINNVVFVTSVIFDIDKDNNPVIYLEIFKSIRATSKAAETGQRIVLKGTGKTAYEALNDVNLASSYQINYTQNKAIIYTKRAAAQGIESYFDIFRRDTQAIIKPYMLVYDGDVERLAKGNFEGEQFIGLFIWDLIINVRSSPRAVQSSLNRYLSRRVSPSRTDVLTVLKIDNDQPNPSLVINGGAIMENDKLVEMLPSSEGQAYNFLVDVIQQGSMEVADPRDSSKYISLSIENSKTDTDVNLRGNTVDVTKKINVKARIVEFQKYMDLTDEELEQIRKGAEANLINACTNIFNKYKKRDLDIFMIGQELENKYGDKIPIGGEVIKHANMKIEPRVFIDSPGKIDKYQQ
ncbi:Ger(x)C family spore germination protein [Clostridium pasteurianum]|uniref:Ger(x)C family spore germination protein n=1 Tax=Clostridium pasteurianum TaxID=1501 RepID=UPI002260CB74|nr:Ger(x)C family spore germination protein [Clostridium pasteurianum]UZW15556.1 Ger(x)C family spore germination protein [Clostridium pasteurianum]